MEGLNMSYNARVYKVFIASPADVENERNIIRSVIEQWNSINSEREKIVLVPIGFDTNAAPEMGRPAQEYINMDILDSCDVVVGVFWTRVGTPTRRHAGGSIEEVLRNSPNRRITMIYFSQKQIQPDKIDQDQYRQLLEFKNNVKESSFYSEFRSDSELSEKLYQHIQLKVNEGKFRPKWDSDIVALIEDENEMIQKIDEHFPNVAANVLEQIIYQNHSEAVWKAITEKLLTSPNLMGQSLLFLARIGACENYVFKNGTRRLATTSQNDFCVFLNNLYSINRYEFFKLYQENLVTNERYKAYLEKIIKQDQVF